MTLVSNWWWFSITVVKYDCNRCFIHSCLLPIHHTWPHICHYTIIWSSSMIDHGQLVKNRMVMSSEWWNQPGLVCTPNLVNWQRAPDYNDQANHQACTQEWNMRWWYDSVPQIADTKYKTYGILLYIYVSHMIWIWYDITHMCDATKMLDLPDPLSPVIAVKEGSQPLIAVRLAYDLNPSITTSFTHITPYLLTWRLQLWCDGCWWHDSTGIIW